MVRFLVFCSVYSLEKIKYASSYTFRTNEHIEDMTLSKIQDFLSEFDQYVRTRWRGQWYIFLIDIFISQL